MQLIGANASPFVHRVRIAARFKGIDLIEAPIPEGGLKGAAVRRMNPMGRMPILVMPDGWVLAESAAIACYLDETFGGPSIWPADARDRARARWYVQLIDGPLDAGLRNVVRSRVVPGSASPVEQLDSSDIAELGIAELNEALGAIAALGEDARQWLVGDRFTLADAALVPILAMLQVIEPWNKVGDRIVVPPHLASYRDRLVKKPLFGDSVKVMTAAFQEVAQRWELTASS